MAHQEKIWLVSVCDETETNVVPEVFAFRTLEAAKSRLAALIQEYYDTRVTGAGPYVEHYAAPFRAEAAKIIGLLSEITAPIEGGSWGIRLGVLWHWISCSEVE